ncbi:TonB-dependent receptor [Aliiglaciecola sp. CAU 1673]|uniref:TonB-dependent receptor n=1 Tax=Aliiglaciecola sp. CAU 1673 TaxID=3032595 RepID=UPI0023DBCD49|nr:TonB-dependent receptor [Aliiglaciecola sp. CAU 1673]MDF2179269.1 TonB-dependent receptor [Aliiglaciecola sp. CAU 1673]
MRQLIVLLATLLSVSSSVWAESEKTPVVHGFISQGVARASHSNFINDSGNISAALTEAGINMSYQFSPSLRLATQAVYLDGGNRYPDGARLDYLFLDWTAWQTEQWQFNVHLGRFKNYHWLHSATRDVPHTRPSIVLPQSVYFDGFRDFSKGNDGIALVAKGESAALEWDIHWSYGRTEVNRSLTRSLLSAQAQGELEQVFDHQFSVFVRPQDGNSQFGLSLVDSDFRYEPSSLDIFFKGGAVTQRAILSYRYSMADWEFSSEALYDRTYFKDLLFPGFERDTRGQGIYFQGRWFVDDKLTLLARLDLFDTDKDDRNGSIIFEQSGGQIPNYFAYMDDFTFGASYDFANHWQVKAELHRFRGIARLTPVFIPNTQVNDREYWNLWAVQLIHWF